MLILFLAGVKGLAQAASLALRAYPRFIRVHPRANFTPLPGRDASPGARFRGCGVR